jgi:polyphenol oxidase
MPNIYLENLNYGRFETWNHRPDFSFHEAKQVHGTEIVSLETLPAEADGLMVSWEEFEQPLAIKTADCMPIVIEGAKGAIFLHAGWRGLANNILSRPEIAMITPQRVLIGPSIHQCCFEVTSEFREHFPESPNFNKLGNRLTFNLQQEAKDQLRKIFPNLLVDISPTCTSCNTAFHSYRRDQTSKRNWNLYIKG